MARPRPLGAAASLTAAEGVALCGGSAYYLERILAGTPHDLTTALFSDALGFTAAVVLLLLSRPLLGGRRFARTPVLLLQLLAIPVAVSLVQAHRVAAGLAVGLPAIATLGFLLAPSARAPFEPPPADRVARAGPGGGPGPGGRPRGGGAADADARSGDAGADSAGAGVDASGRGRGTDRTDARGTGRSRSRR